MASTKTKTEVAEVKNTAVAQTYDYGDDAGSGFENTGGKDLSIPFINLLQSNSPEVQASTDGSIRIGMMKNSVTGELYQPNTGFIFCPVHYDEAFVEWVPRTKGGGFVGLHDPTSEEVAAAIKANGGRIPKKGADGKKIPLKVGDNELVETYYMYGLLLEEDGESANGFAVIAFTSTKIKPYRDFLTSMFLVKGKPPVYAFRARFTTSVEKNEAGTFANYVIQPFQGGNWAASLIPPTHPLYGEAKEFRNMVKSGLARANFDHQEDASGGGPGSSPAGDEAPF